MYTPVVDDWLRLTIYCQEGDQVANNVFYFQLIGITGGGLDLKTISSLFGGRVKGAYAALMNNEARYYGCKAEVPFKVPVPQWQTTSAPQNGTAGETPLPRQTAGIITWYTEVIGKSKRGRTYIPFPAAEDQDTPNDRPTPGYVANLNGLADLLTIDVELNDGAGNSAVLALGIRSQLLGTFEDVESYVSRYKWATQRRRGDYGQSNSTPF